MIKFIMMMTFLLIASAPSYAAGTPITNEMAEKYFANCVANAEKDGTMSKDSQNKYCACTAMNMQQSMTQQDLTALSSHGDTARAALNKVLISVNGPCMQYPTHDLLDNKCMADVKNSAICSCLSNKMGNFMKDISKRMLPALLANDPNIFDPMTPIMESPEFVQTQQKIALSCATNPNQN